MANAVILHLVGVGWAAASLGAPDAEPQSSLVPITTATRTAVELSNTVWKIRPDPWEEAERNLWVVKGLPQPSLNAPVPATLNDIVEKDPLAAEVGWTSGYFGAVYYETEFVVPRGCDGRVALRFASTTFNAVAWVNGARVGGHAGCCTPWETLDLNASLLAAAGTPNRLIVRVDGARTWQSIPPGGSSTGNWGQPVLLGGDAGYYYSTPGIDGRVHLICTAAAARLDHIAVATSFHGGAAAGTTGVVQSTVVCRGPGCGTHTWRVAVPGVPPVTHSASPDGVASTLTLSIPNATLWWPVGSGATRTPALYKLQIDLLGSDGTTLTDSYSLSVGIRTVSVSPTGIAVNGETVYLRGADCHQDAVLRGHGVDLTAVVANMNVMRSIGMNSFRFNSWPAPEELLSLCDEHGFLVQEEVPAIALRGDWDTACPASTPGGIFNSTGHCANGSTLAAHTRAVTELIKRDGNHPSVGAWSLANEPEVSLPGKDAADPGAVAYFGSLVGVARTADPQRRPVTIELDGACYDFHTKVGLDLVSIHNYPGWYDLAPVVNVTADMAGFIKGWANAVPHKPIFVSEYGAGAVAGNHRIPPIPYTEEFQVAVLKADHAAFDQFRAVMGGEHVHSFHDFEQAGASNEDGKTLVTDILGLNYKGLHSRAMEPKAAVAIIAARYHRLAAHTMN